MPLFSVISNSLITNVSNTKIPCIQLEIRDAYTDEIILPSSEHDNYLIYSFTKEKQSFYLNKFVQVNLILVAGGGSGGSRRSETSIPETTNCSGFPGGGAGEVVIFPKYQLSPQTIYLVSVGKGGEHMANGECTTIQSSLNPLENRIAVGGGTGGSYALSSNGQSGGSGGGAVPSFSYQSMPGNANLSYEPHSTSFGNPGGRHLSGVTQPKGPGGGGAFSEGESSLSGKGGIGIVWVDGKTYGGGGSGGQYIPPNVTYNGDHLYDSIAGGLGGGGDGAGFDRAATDGENGFGGGGGGSNRLFPTGGKGGSGIVHFAVIK